MMSTIGDAEAEFKQLHTVSHDLCTMLFEYYGKHITLPRRELFEKATGLRVTPADQSQGFRTSHEAVSAMEEARRQDLIQHHVYSVSGNRGGMGNTKGGRGKKHGRGGRGGKPHNNNLRHISATAQQTTQQQRPSTPAPAGPANAAGGAPATPAPKSTPPARGPKGGGRGRGRGKGQ